MTNDKIPHLWWQRPGIVPSIMLVVLIALVAVIIAGYYFAWPWAGFTAYIDPKGDYHPDKTLWDWLSLLFVPVVIGGVAYAFRRTEQEIERQRAEQRVRTEQQAALARAATEQALAEDAQREAALQSYIDRMTQLLLENGLRASDEDTEVRAVARTVTLTVLRRLDPIRKRVVMQFLYEGNLISTPEKAIPVVRLWQADLTGADLQWAYLHGADLFGVNLQEADLFAANLKGAELREADLLRASLQDAILAEADLSGASLEGAILRGADLSGACLQDAILAEADLSGASLEGARLEGANLANIQYDDQTIWPDGFTPPTQQPATGAPQKSSTP